MGLTKGKRSPSRGQRDSRHLWRSSLTRLKIGGWGVRTWEEDAVGSCDFELGSDHSCP